MADLAAFPRVALAVAGRLFRVATASLRRGGPYGSIMLGSLTVAALWAGVIYHLAEEKSQAEQAAIQNTSNLARAFEEHIVRTLRAVDQTLLYVRASYALDPAHFDMSLWTENGQFLTGLTFQVSIIDKDGYLVASNRDPHPGRMDLSDRDHFRVHVQSKEDKLFISQSVLGRVSAKRSLQLTRRIDAPDGSFAGVVVVSLDPRQLSRFYESVDLGAGGVVTLLGLDGVVRARATRTDTTSGESLVNSVVLRDHTAHAAGSFAAASGIDGVKRLSSYRDVAGFPLIVVVGLAEDEILAAYHENRLTYLVVAALLSVLLLAVTTLMARHQIGLQRTREELRASEIKYRSLVDNLDEVVFRTDAEGRWTFLNPAYAGLTGFSVAETLGRFPLEHIHPDDQQANRERFRQLVTRGVDHWRDEIRYITKSGVARWFEVSAHVALDGDKVAGTYGTLRDVTARHEAAEALRAGEARLAQKSELLELTLENMSQGIMMVDRGRQVQVCNRRAAELLGLPESLLARQPGFDEILQWQWQAGEFGDAADGDFASWLHRFVRSGGIAEAEQTYERRRPNGTVLEIRSIPIPNGGVVRTYTDVTQQKSAESALRSALEAAAAAAKAKSEFLAMMSHEIRSPMSGLLGIIELLRQTSLEVEQKRMVELVHGSASTLMHVLNDVLDFSKIEAGRMDVAAEPTAMRPLVAAVVEPLSLAADSKGLALESDVAAELPAAFMVDPLRLKQILVNLIGNAIKFTASGAVRLTVAREAAAEGAAMICFAVRDTGIGIEPAVLARLFEPFTQADASTTRNFGGTGLGLTISRRLARLLAGDLTAVSVPGRGSTFSLCLPLVEAELPAETAEAAVADSTAVGSGRFGDARVLIAEDQLTNRWLLRRQLERLGVAADAVEDGHAALRALAQGSYDMLITDCHMPGMEGTELTRRIRDGERAAAAGQHLPILALTADVTPEMLERCRAAGMDHVELKPITMPRLDAMLRRLLLRQAPDETTAPVAQPASPVFDATTYEELFDGNDAVGREWLDSYRSSADELIGELHAAIAARHAEDVAAIAHRLAGATLSVGATRAGMLCRTLEVTAKTSDWSCLPGLAAEAIGALGEARREIDRFADSRGALVL